MPAKNKQNNGFDVSKLKRPAMNHTQVLKTHEAQSLFLKSFDYTNSATMWIDVIIDRIITHEDYKNVNTVVAEQFSKCRATLDELTDKMIAKKNEYGIDATLEYPGQEEYTKEIYTPTAIRYISLIKKMDDLICHVDSLWFHEAITKEQKMDVVDEASKAILALSQFLISLNDRAQNFYHKMKQERKEKNKAKKQKKTVKSKTSAEKPTPAKEEEKTDSEKSKEEITSTNSDDDFLDLDI